MIEAGVHYYQATGHTDLLEAATKMANLMCDVIGPPPKANVIPGHSLAEDALVNLYLLYHNDPKIKQSVSVPVDENRFLQLAEYFINARGNYDGRTGRNKSYGEYGQDHAPLAQQSTIEGHAVRAMLFCTGIASVAYVDAQPGYLSAALRFADDFDKRKLFISGGAGSLDDDEKFGKDYDLPNHGYMETCAAVAGGFFNNKMNLLYGDAKYADEIERTLYNAVLGGASLSGDHYYYQNPLVSNAARRWAWHECPCCPPMFLKFMGALPSLIYAQETNAVYVNLFIGSQANVTLNDTKVQVAQTTNYPWSGDVKITVNPEKPVKFDLFVRVPGWSYGGQSTDDLYQTVDGGKKTLPIIKVNGQTIENIELVRGYAKLSRDWQKNDAVEVSFDMRVRQIRANDKVTADTGLVALMRGPILYCVETVDNPDGVNQLVVPPETTFRAEFNPTLLGGVEVLKGEVSARQSAKDKDVGHTTITAIPFYASANREPCQMRVWLPASADKALAPTIATTSLVSASRCWHLDYLPGINDGLVPEKSNDKSVPHFSWLDHKGTTEWCNTISPTRQKSLKYASFGSPTDRTVVDAIYPNLGSFSSRMVNTGSQ